MQMLRDGHAKQQNEEFMTSSFKGNRKTSEDPKHLLSDAKYGTVKKEAKNKKTKKKTKKKEKKHNVKAQFQIGGKKRKRTTTRGTKSCFFYPHWLQ